MPTQPRWRGPAWALVALAPAVLADPVSYTGKIVDGAGTPLPWALISVEGSSLRGQANADGAFSIAGEAPMGLAPHGIPSGAAAVGAAPDRCRADGRATDPPVTSMLLWSRASEGRSSVASAHPALRKAGAAAWTLDVSMARFRTGAFPQTAATAKGLVLVLAPSDSDTAAYAAEKQVCLDTLNALRAGIGKPKLAWSKSLEAFADQGVRYDAQRDSAHAHFSAWSKGAIPADAENAIPGWPLRTYKTVDAVVKAGAKMMWDEGPGGGHYDNIAGDQKEVGCGIYVTPQGGAWIIHDFK